MSSATDAYYEQSSLWGGQKEPSEILRLNETLAMLPADARSVLEVGCGDGFILNAVARQGGRERLAGTDFSSAALKHVKAPALIASADALPFADRSWDAVMCLEVLEHLPQDVYARTLAELQRVSARHILITVPNRDDLLAAQVTCPKCYCRFNLHRHVRAFRTDTMDGLFDDFSLVACKTIGVKRRYFARTTLVRFGRAIGALNAFPSHAVCPQCGFQKSNHARSLSQAAPSNNSRLKSLAKKLAPGVTEGKWILALYQRRRSG
jgi:SAM-dependent methyltransferase